MPDHLLDSDHESQAAQIYARTAAIHESSARLLRTGGHGAAAARVERFAALSRDRNAEPAMAARLHSRAGRLRHASRLEDVVDEALDGAIDVLAADFGNVQLADPQTGSLRIVSQRGFARDFLDHFAVVGDERSACGRAATDREQAVIADVNDDPAFAPHRATAAAAGFRAVQSTPLIDSAGSLRGVLSTHYHAPHSPSARELRLIAAYARLVADAIAKAS